MNLRRFLAEPRRRALAVLAAAAGAALTGWGGRAAWRAWTTPVRLDTVRGSYLHYDIIDIRLRARDPKLLERWRKIPPRAAVVRDGRVVTTIGGIESVPLVWDAAASAFVGRWPCPWNAPAGHYWLELPGDSGLGGRLRATPFEIAYRRPKRLPKHFVAVTLESSRHFGDWKVKTPDGTMRGWRGMLDWAEFVGADAFWIMVGESPGRRPGEVWVSHNLPLIPMVAAECRKRGIALGVYAMVYLTMSRTDRLARYEYASEVVEGAPVLTRAISLRDPRRPQDVIDLLNSLKTIPGVEYLGLDYIRNAQGGEELIDDFLAEMPGLRPPAGWERLTPAERMTWFVRKRILRKDQAFMDAWQWWRARRVALIVRRIKDGVGDDKHLWAFTLTWAKGWNHGQDPVMMNDAGVDVDALMFYEATAEQFRVMVKDWGRYVRRSDAQLVVGDIVDWPLHQRSRKGPRDMRERLTAAIHGVYRDGPAAGIFIHDLGRAVGGRLGAWSTKEWLAEARRTAAHLRSLPAGGPGL